MSLLSGMDEKPRHHRWPRFGLVALFALVAAAAIAFSLWNPFPKPSKSNFGLVEVGMTEDDVADLVGKPDHVETYNAKGRLIHLYHVRYGEAWTILFVNGKVYKCGQVGLD